MRMRNGVFLASALLLLALNGVEARAQWITTNGPSGSPTRAFTTGAAGTRLLAGTASGGVFVASADRSSWSATNSGLSDPNVLCLTTGVNEFGGEVVLAGTAGGGVFASWNAGSSWTAMNTGLTDDTVPAIVAVRDAYFEFGMVLLSGTEGGAFRSNGGFNIQWVSRSGGMTNPVIQAMVTVPGGDENDGLGAQDAFAGTDGGVFLSNDGITWWPKNTGLTNTNVTALAATRPGPLTWALFAGTPAGVFRSTDLWGSWTAVSSGLTGGAVQALLGVGNRLLAGTGSGGVFLSLNQGDTWTAVNTGLPNLAITALGSDGIDVFAATGAGVYRRPIAELDPTAGVDGDAAGARLGAPHPNPFTSSSSVSYRLDASGGVRLLVHDVQGRRVAELVQGALPAGDHQARWDGREASGSRARAGLYFLRLEADGRVASRPIVLMP